MGEADAGVCGESAGLEKVFDSLEIKQIPREENQKADYMATIESFMTDCHERKIIVFGVGKEEVMMVEEEADDWRTRPSYIF